MTEDIKWQKNWDDHEELFDRIKEASFWTKFSAFAIPPPTTVVIMGILILIE